MQSKPPRKLIQRSFRIFEDQLESLQWLANIKYRGLRKVSDLVREALEQAIEKGKSR
jgi:hypothetical protein